MILTIFLGVDCSSIEDLGADFVGAICVMEHLIVDVSLLGLEIFENGTAC